MQLIVAQLIVAKLIVVQLIVTLLIVTSAEIDSILGLLYIWVTFLVLRIYEIKSIGDRGNVESTAHRLKAVVFRLQQTKGLCL